jgi:nicotinamidase-related amidase
MTSNHAVFFVDLQQNQFDPRYGIYNADTFLVQMTEALAAARQQGDLVIHIQHDGPAGDMDEPFSAAWQLVLPVASHEKIYRKTVFSAFSENPELVDYLQSHGITHVTIIGVQSEYCIQANARAARAAGFAVHVPRGMHSTADAQVVADIHATLVAEGFSRGE